MFPLINCLNLAMCDSLYYIVKNKVLSSSEQRSVLVSAFTPRIGDVCPFVFVLSTPILDLQ